MTYRLFLPDGNGVIESVVADDRPHRAAVARAIERRQSAALVRVDHGIQALFFDMDATVIAQESIDELAKVAGVGAQVELITTAAMNGRIDFPMALRERVALLKGLSLAAVADVGRSLTINLGMTEFLATARRHGVKCYIVSGGFTTLVAPVAATLGFDDMCANTLGVANGTLTGTVDGAIVDGAMKREYVARTMTTLGASPQQAAVVGDGANDRPMMQSAGVAFGFHPKAILTPDLDGATFSDHRLLARFLWPGDKGL